MGGVTHFFEPESKLGFGRNPDLPTEKAPVYPLHFLLSLFTKEDRWFNAVSYKRCFLGDWRWAGFEYIPWEREVSCLPGSIGKVSLVKKPTTITTTRVIKVFLVNSERFDNKIVFGFD